MYQYNSIMSAVNDFIDEVNESDSKAKLVKPHTIKEAYELLAGYYGKETGAELLAEYESGRPHDVADATKLLLDVMKGDRKAVSKDSSSLFSYYVTDGNGIRLNKQGNNETNYVECQAGLKLVSLLCKEGKTIQTVVIISDSPFTANEYHIENGIKYYQRGTSTYEGNEEGRLRSMLTSSKVIIDDVEYQYVHFSWYTPLPTDVIRSNYWPWYSTSSYSYPSAQSPYTAKYAVIAINNGIQLPLPDRN